jgi:L-malate glycosyltransferase
MKVLHVTLSFARGGRRTAITSLIQGLRSLEIESGLCCLDELGCLPEETAALEFPVKVLRRRSLLDLTALRGLRQFCREGKFDVIHTHDAASQFTAALSCLGMRRTPLLMTFHRSLGMESATLSDRVRNAWSSSRCGAIVTGSHERRAHFLSRNLIRANKVVRFPFGTDMSRFHPSVEIRTAIRQELLFEPEVTLLGVVGHFGTEKGVDVAIRAFQALQNQPLAAPVALVIFGDGSRRAELERLASEASGAKSRVVFAGFRNDIDRCLQGLDILLHAPREEAFGLVVIEAMATGLPVVASSVGGIPDLVRDGRTGFLAQSENPESFAPPLARLINDRNLQLAMGREARRVALAEYDRVLFARRHLDLYRALLDRREPSSASSGPVSLTAEPAGRNSPLVVQHEVGLTPKEEQREVERPVRGS